MPFQVWVETEKENVQKVKLILEQTSQLSSVNKVKRGMQDGYMIVPTNTICEDDIRGEAEDYQILSALLLTGTSQHAKNKPVYLPCLPPSLTPSKTKVGPIQEAISEWLNTLPESILLGARTTRSDLLEHSPKRWSTYEPMVLLPSGSLQDTVWKDLLQSLAEPYLSNLWTKILHTIWVKEGGRELTHLAINSGIPLKQGQEHEDPPTTINTTPTPTTNNHDIFSPLPSAPQENILRRPSHLIPLHGDFGPPNPPGLEPSETDFEAAFWVTAKQNGIVQTWAPRHTMFSRGNIKEKARLLAFHDGRASTARKEGPKAAAAAAAAGLEPAAEPGPVAIDLYAGIGYFVFSYAAAGFARVLCWEINPWSVEGLRRGCLLNGWSCRVVRGEEELKLPIGELMCSGEGEEEKVLVFEEGNEHAVQRVLAIRRWEEEEGREGRSVLGDVVHVNCGFLPSSEGSWRSAWMLACKSRDAWLHLHENVGVEDVQRRGKEIESLIGNWASEEGGTSIVEMEHVELVKTFAPGVWHCVFDVHIKPALPT